MWPGETAGGARPGTQATAIAGSVDIRGVACPMTWVRTRLALGRIAAGEILEVLLLGGEPLENVPRTAEEEGHRVALREPWPGGGQDAWRVLLVKGVEAERGILP
jgi:tRNA 2-thiouridine synthesizing protein A